MSQPSIDLGALGADALEVQVNELQEQSPADELVRSIEEIEATGESEDGRVRVVMRADGTMADISIEPRLLREGSEAVAEAVKQAVNSAAGEARAQMTRRLEDETRPGGQFGEALQSLQGIIDQVLTSVARVESRLR